MRAIWLGLACGIFLVIPTAGQAQPKKGLQPPANAQPGTPEDYANLNKQKEVQCKLVTRDPDLGPDIKAKKHLVFRYEYEATDANPNYKPTKVPKPHDFTKEILALQQKQAVALQNPNIQKRMAALQQLAIQQQQLMARINDEQVKQAQREAAAREQDIRNNNVPFIKVMRAKEFEVEIQSDVLVRRLKPAMDYDDRGFIKEYTKEELDKLHLVDNADKKKPGIPAKYDDLRPKQTIVVFLTPGKKMEKPKADPPATRTDGEKSDKADKADKTDKAEQAEPFIPLRPTVRMVVIVEDVPDPNGALDPTLPPRKKKKQ